MLKNFRFVTSVRPIVHDTYKTAKINFINSGAVDIIRFTKRLQGFRHYPYEKRLQYIPLLEPRRLEQDLSWCYKIFFGHVNVNRDTFFELRVSATRGDPYKLCEHFNSYTVRCTFFADRVINTWNKLPHPGVDFSSLTFFKRTLKMFTLLSLSFDFSLDFIVDFIVDLVLLI